MKGCTDKLRKRVQNNDYVVFGCINDSHSGAVVEAYHEAGYDVVLIARDPSVSRQI